MELYLYYLEVSVHNHLHDLRERLHKPDSPVLPLPLGRSTMISHSICFGILPVSQMALEFLRGRVIGSAHGLYYLLPGLFAFLGLIQPHVQKLTTLMRRYEERP